MSLMEGVQHLNIPLDEIKMATNNFGDENFIARGGFGRVYIGKLTVSGHQIHVAVKRLDRAWGQGNREFLSEIQMLSCYRHKNLITLVGFCDEGGENILVYEYVKHRSLDKHLSDDDLSWMQRLQISVGAAHGFYYLHNQAGPQHRVLHRDIKSSNILLTENWEAKISDFGLSKIGPSNVDFTFLITNACGTYGYVDPQYVRTGILTKESDVYSFGVVLFEILCGRLARISEYQDKRRFLAPLAQRYYEKNKLVKIIHPSLKNQMKVESLNMFSMVAYRCLRENRSERPTMGWIVEKLEKALELQENEGESCGSKVGRLKTSENFIREVQKSWRNNLVFFEGSSNYKFDIEDLFSASREFLRNDGYATTYKAVLDGGIIVSVKKLKGVVVTRSTFIQQMEMIGRVARHLNVVPLLAYYYSNDEKLLVYDCATLDSLSSLLHGSWGSGRMLIDWKTILRVVLDTSRGIAHIHSSCRGKLTHGNIRSSNVLLNQDNHGRLIDFGLAPLMGITAETSPYKAPEVTKTKKPTQMSDVYSFGVLLFEMLTGKLPVQTSAGQDEVVVDLPAWVQSMQKEAWTDWVFDVDLMTYQTVEEMGQIMKIAEACIAGRPESRPQMDQVVRMIEEINLLDVQSAIAQPEQPHQSKTKYD